MLSPAQARMLVWQVAKDLDLARIVEKSLYINEKRIAELEAELAACESRFASISEVAANRGVALDEIGDIVDAALRGEEEE